MDSHFVSSSFCMSRDIIFCPNGLQNISFSESCHSFPIRFRFGLWLSLSNTLYFQLSCPIVSLAVYLGLFSCWDLKLHPHLKFFAASNSFSSKTVKYLAPSIVQSTLSSYCSYYNFLATSVFYSAVLASSLAQMENCNLRHWAMTYSRSLLRQERLIWVNEGFFLGDWL